MLDNPTLPKESSLFNRSFLRQRDGFTFVEIMVTLVILSVGILAIYQVLFASLDHMDQLNTRLYANVLLEDRIATIERTLRAYNTLPFETDVTERLDLGVREVRFFPRLEIKEVSGFPDVFQLDLSYGWAQGERTIHLSRSAYISDFVSDETTQP